MTRANQFCRIFQILAISILLSGFATAGKAVAETADLSCAYFSKDPDDRSGPPITFYADLSDDAQSLPTDSPGIGRADFILERDTLKLFWTVKYSDLTTQPVALNMHGPKAAAVDAPVLFDMTPESFESPVKGERTLSLGEATNLVQHLLYINLQTTRYPEGELRGPVQKARPVC